MKLVPLLLVIVGFASVARAADKLKLNPKLNHNNDSQNGRLIIRANMDTGCPW